MAVISNCEVKKITFTIEKLAITIHNERKPYFFGNSLSLSGNVTAVPENFDMFCKHI